MQTKKILTHEDVLKIAAGAEAEARANKWAVGIAVVDDGGHPLWFVRLDGAMADDLSTALSTSAPVPAVRPR